MIESTSAARRAAAGNENVKCVPVDRPAAMSVDHDNASESHRRMPGLEELRTLVHKLASWPIPRTPRLGRDIACQQHTIVCPAGARNLLDVRLSILPQPNILETLSAQDAGGE